MNGAAVLLFFAGIGVVLATALLLARTGDRWLVAAFIALGLITSAGKIALFQMAPQWQEVNPDAVLYDLNARALVRHWAGSEVPVKEYQLRGLDARNTAVWTPTETLSYTAILGTQDSLYTAYVAIWYRLAGADKGTVIFSNAMLAAFFPAAAFGIALAIAGSRRVAQGAAVIGMLDPSSGVNAAWLIKDTLIGFLAMIALWAAVAYVRDRRGWLLLIMSGALGLLGTGRFVAFIAMLVALAAWIGWALRHTAFKQVLPVVVAIAAAIALESWIVSLPHTHTATPAAVVRSILMPLKGGVETLKADAKSEYVDSTVLRWTTALKDNPLLALTKSVAHTLFAPYPWVAIYPGLTWRSFTELYYPGTILWILMLPGIFRAIVQLACSRDQGGIIVLTFLGALLLAYTVFLGEWSTRERVFALPAFFALGAFGWSLLLARRGVATARSP